MDRETKEYKLHVVYYMKTSGNNCLFEQVYDSHVNEWLVVESRKAFIIRWEDSNDWKDPSKIACVYNYANGNLQHFNPSNIAPGLKVAPNCIEFINDHLFVLHEKAPPSSTNLV